MSAPARRVHSGNVIAVDDASGAGTLAAARACRPRLLVAPFPSAPEEVDLIEALLRRTPSALMLVRDRSR